MSVLLGALVLLLLGLLGARFSFTWAHAPLGPRTFMMAGTHFLLVGVVLGSDAVGLLTASVLQPLYPLAALAIGWIGLMFGLQLDHRQLREIPGRVIMLALLQAAFAFLLFAGTAYGLLRLGGTGEQALGAAVLAAAAIACVSSPPGIAVVANLTRLRGGLSELLLFIASLDALIGIAAMQVTHAVYHPLELGNRHLTWAGPEWAMMAVGLGLAFGIIFLWLARTGPDRHELSLYLMGTAAFTAGTALYLGLSPLFVSLTAGAVIANFSPIKERVFRTLQHSEKPLYVMILVMVGATLDLGRWLVLPLGAGFVLLRLSSKLAGGWLATHFLPTTQRPPGGFGLALGSLSGMAVVLLLDLTMSYGALEGPPAIELLTGTAVVAVILSELTGPVLTRRILEQAEGRMVPTIPPGRSHA